MDHSPVPDARSCPAHAPSPTGSFCREAMAGHDGVPKDCLRRQRKPHGVDCMSEMPMAQLRALRETATFTA
jgi:hypothetical protein